MPQKIETTVTVNAEQRLYVIPCGKGYTCLGFDVCERKSAAVAKWCGITERDFVPLGTLEHYAEHSLIMAIGAEYARRTGERCPADLESRFVGLEGKRVQVTDIDGNRRRFYVGKSMGWMPCHLEIKTRRSIAGGATYLSPTDTVQVVGVR